jgi:branched-subunit amino acid aminotransferase/4-amino-4-deoxychorismate lyase
VTPSHPSVTGPPVALKETCRVAGGVVPLWPYHRARLAGGGCPDALLAELDGRVASAGAAWANARTRRARLTVVVAPGGDCSVEVEQRLSSLDVIGGLVAVRVDIAEPPPLPRPAAKPADRSWWDAMHRIAEKSGGHQAVLVTSDGMVADGSTACVWIAEGGRLITPPTPHAIPGVSRTYLLESATHACLAAFVEPIAWERYTAADEAFFTNAFGGTAPVRGRGGPIFSAVKGLFDDVWRAGT